MNPFVMVFYTIVSCNPAFNGNGSPVCAEAYSEPMTKMECEHQVASGLPLNAFLSDHPDVSNVAYAACYISNRIRVTP